MILTHLCFPFIPLTGRSAPRRVCVLLANGVAVYCAAGCGHGEYDSRGRPVEVEEEQLFRWEPVVTRGGQLRYYNTVLNRFCK